MKLVLCSFLLFLSNVSTAAPLMNVENLNRNLSSEKAEWVAKDNWLNNLPKSQLKKMMGLADAPAPEVEFILPTGRVKESLPTKMDWRNHQGKNWVSPILNQANCGSCVAFAAVGVMETQLNISSFLPNLNVKLSPQNLFSCGGGGCDSGWYPDSAADHLMKVGIPDEACMPYLSGATGKDISCNLSCSQTAQRSLKIANYSSPTRSATSIEEVKRALLKGPLMTTLTVYSDFITYSSGVYKHTKGDYLGGHAVSIVGYDDSLQAFIVRNSWGQEWGENGFVNVSYKDTSGIGRSTWAFDLPAGSGSVTTQSPMDYQIVSGMYDFKAFATYSNASSITVEIFNDNDQSVWKNSCVSANCSLTADTSAIGKDGRYEIVSTAYNQNGDKIDQSARHFFYIANSKSELAVAFKGNGVDLNKPVKDRIEFDVTTKSTGVPMSQIEFHFKGQGLDKSRSAFVVLPQMTMGFRTNIIPNGEYEIWMTGKITTNEYEISAESTRRKITVKN